MDTPAPDLDTALDRFRQCLADLGVVISTVVELPQSAHRLLVPLRDGLVQLQESVDTLLRVMS
jgi:hypothetical protein